MTAAALADPSVAADPATDAGRLRAEAVGVTLGERTLLAPTSLAFERSTVTGIVGHNGSGKTTLLKCLARQSTPTTGRVLLEGTPAADWGSRPFARKLAYLPQQTPVSTGLTGRELVAMGRYPWHGALGRVGPHGHAAVEEAMRLSDTVMMADRLIDTLSGGERQRVWIAMLIAQEAGFVLLDEPLAALDLAHQIEVMRLLCDLARTRQAGIVLVIHDINIAARFCDTIIALGGGTVLTAGSPEAIMQVDVLERIFGVPMRVLGTSETGPVAVPA